MASAFVPPGGSGMAFQAEQDKSYHVEVSGWDISENFFVEKTLLDWGHDAQQEIRVRSTLREGCIVFVRLLQPLENGNNLPIAYQAVKVMPKESDGWTRICLAKLHPRTPYKESSKSESDSIIRIA
jgi:hypothetical protein